MQSLVLSDGAVTFNLRLSIYIADQRQNRFLQAFLTHTQPFWDETTESF